MQRDDAAVLLSAYLDGELEPADHARAEELLRTRPELVVEAQAFGGVGEALRGELDAAAQRVDFAAMESAVMQRLFEGSVAAPMSAGGHPGGLMELLRGLLRRPAVSFGLGAAVAAALWALVSSAMLPPEGAAPEVAAGSSTGGSGDGEPPAQAGAMMAGPPVMVETLNVRRGEVFFDCSPRDPEAPAVLWHFNEGAAGGGFGDPSPSAPPGDPL